MADQNPPAPPKSQAMTLHQRQFSVVKQSLEKAKLQLQAVLPRHIEAERVIRIAMSAISKNDKLLQCTPRSILLAVMQSCQLGLEPGGVLGLAYLVPFKDECQLVPGYRGYVELARRSGIIHSVSAACVYEGEHFKMRRGLQEILEHEPVVAREVGPFRGAYAIARLKSGPPQWDFMDCFEIEAIRERSKQKDSGPWQTDYGEMAKKTVIRRLSKLLPLSAEMAAAYELDNRSETGERGYTEILDVGEVLDAEPERVTAPPRTSAPPPAAALAPTSTPQPQPQPQPASAAPAPEPASAPAAPTPSPTPAARRSDPAPDQPNPKAEEIRKQMEEAPAPAAESKPESLPAAKAEDWGLNPSERSLRFDRALDQCQTEADVKKAGTAYNAELKAAIAEADAKKDRGALHFLQIERAASLKSYNDRIRWLKEQEQQKREKAVEGMTLALPPQREREPGDDDEDPAPPAGAA